MELPFLVSSAAPVEEGGKQLSNTICRSLGAEAPEIIRGWVGRRKECEFTPLSTDGWLAAYFLSRTNKV